MSHTAEWVKDMGYRNDFYFLSRLFLSRFSRKDIPLTVIFNITTRCNAKCSYCYAEYYRREIKDFTTEEVYSIVDKLKRLGCQRISLSGGEPLLREDVGEIINYIKACGISCVINSNGYLVPEKIHDIKRVNTLVLSLDGNERMHDLNRGKGSFKKVMRAYERAMENGIPLHTATILTRNNLNAIDFVLEFAKKNNVWTQFNIVVDKLFTNHRGTSKTDIEPYKEAIKKLLQRKTEGYPVYFSSRAFEYVLKWDDYHRENFVGSTPDFPYVRCSAGKYRCVVDADGNMYPCEILIGKTPGYNILKDDEDYIFSHLSRHNCKACYLVQQNEFNLLYQLNPTVILNYLRMALKAKR